MGGASLGRRSGVALTNQDQRSAERVRCNSLVRLGCTSKLNLSVVLSSFSGWNVETYESYSTLILGRPRTAVHESNGNLRTAVAMKVLVEAGNAEPPWDVAIADARCGKDSAWQRMKGENLAAAVAKVNIRRAGRETQVVTQRSPNTSLIQVGLIQGEREHAAERQKK